MSTPQQTPAPARREWDTPRLNRIGTIADVSQQGPGTPQGGTKS